ncbi:alpha/beta hydrolase family esterase [Humitalea sp. 24SJ18S-53]|uniref:alpha/beta hydrolase family esterase n=1 Tax=Humitalea sp. 24SJ18S-53 TaxID=3422307 RepID=UPI003D673C08
MRHWGLLLLGCLLSAPAGAGETLVAIPHQGMDRSVVVATPDGPGPFPLIIGLHGAGQTGARQRAGLAIDAVALPAGYAIAFPDGVSGRWQYSRPNLRGPEAPTMMPDGAPIDDRAFVEALAARLVALGIADPHRLYLTGFSVGALMTLSAGCGAPMTWAAIAVLAGGITDLLQPGCAAGPPLPTLFVIGDEDRTFPVTGFVNPRGRMLSQSESLAIMATRQGCTPGQERPAPDGFLITEAVGCAAGAAALARLPGQGHSEAPGTVALIIDFFSRYRR